MRKWPKMKAVIVSVKELADPVKNPTFCLSALRALNECHRCEIFRREWRNRREGKLKCIPQMQEGVRELLMEKRETHDRLKEIDRRLGYRGFFRGLWWSLLMSSTRAASASTQHPSGDTASAVEYDTRTERSALSVEPSSGYSNFFGVMSYCSGFNVASLFRGTNKMTESRQRVCPNCNMPDAEGLEYMYRIYRCTFCKTEFGVNAEGEKIIIILKEKDDPNWTDTQHAYHNGIRLLYIFRHTKDWDQFEDALDKLVMIERNVK